MLVLVYGLPERAGIKDFVFDASLLRFAR